MGCTRFVRLRLWASSCSLPGLGIFLVQRNLCVSAVGISPIGRGHQSVVSSLANGRSLPTNGFRRMSTRYRRLMLLWYNNGLLMRLESRMGGSEQDGGRFGHFFSRLPV